MAKRKLQAIDRKISKLLSEGELRQLKENYNKEILTNPIFSLEVDPNGKLGLDDLKREFVKNYVYFNSIRMVSLVMDLKENECYSIYRDLAVQEEIKRIKRAMFQRQFNNKILDLDNIASYLSAIISDEIPVSEQLNIMDKLEVIKLLLKVHEMSSNAFNDPSTIENKNFEIVLKNASVSTIQELLRTLNYDDQRNISEEEIDIIKNMTTEQQIDLLNELTKGEN